MKRFDLKGLLESTDGVTTCGRCFSERLASSPQSTTTVALAMVFLTRGSRWVVGLSGNGRAEEGKMRHSEDTRGGVTWHRAEIPSVFVGLFVTVWSG